MDDVEFVRTCIDTLKPWRHALPAETLHNLSSDNVTPRLARILSETRIRSDARKQDWSGVTLTFEMHGLEIISDIEFLSLLEGELLPIWASKIQECLLKDIGALTEAADMLVGGVVMVDEAAAVAVAEIVAAVRGEADIRRAKPGHLAAPDLILAGVGGDLLGRLVPHQLAGQRHLGEPKLGVVRGQIEKLLAALLATVCLPAAGCVV